MEHYWKSLVHHGDTVSVHRPGFFAKRFLNFMKDKVFKKQTVQTPKPSASENVPSMNLGHTSGHRNISSSVSGPGPASSRKSQYRRAVSTNTGPGSGPYETANISHRAVSEIHAPPVRGGTSKVIFNEYHLVYMD